MWLVIHVTLIIPQKKTAVLLFGKIAAFFLGNFFYSPFTFYEIVVLLYVGVVENSKLCAVTEGELFQDSADVISHCALTEIKQ